MSNADIKIFVSGHKPCKIFESRFIYPLHVGAALSDKKLDGFLRDDEGDNISRKNKYYCELTGQYWAWKNISADYYGFMHYRRYFSFSGRKLPQNGIGEVVVKDTGKASMDYIGFDDGNIESVITSHDLIILKKTFILARIKNEYSSSVFQSGKDFSFCIDIIEKEFPHMKNALDIYLNSRSAYLKNMFIMKNELFHRYAEWLFYILKKHEDTLDFDEYDAQSYRVSGYLAERLCGIYLTWLQENKNLKVKEVQCAFIKDTELEKEMLPKFSGNYYAAAFPVSVSDFYSSAVLLQSIISNSRLSERYDLIAIENSKRGKKITEKQKAVLREMVKLHPNISLRFAENGITENDILSAPYLCRNFDKLLYLSPRTVINENISPLFGTDLSGAIAACAVDLGFAIAGGGDKIKRVKKTNALLNASYYHETKDALLRSDKKKDVYINDSVALINVKRFLEIFPTVESLQSALPPKSKYPSDAFNYIVKNEVRLLDLKYNCPFDDCGLVVPKVYNYAPHYINDKYTEARKEPAIINFNGYQEPARFPGCDMADLFWEKARCTPAYEQMIKALSKKPRTPAPIIKHKIKNFFLPPGSPLWQGYTRFIKKF